MVVSIYSSPEVHAKPRTIPDAPEELPKEITIGSR